jgi:hypothetical protein
MIDTYILYLNCGYPVALASIFDGHGYNRNRNGSNAGGVYLALESNSSKEGAPARQGSSQGAPQARGRSRDEREKERRALAYAADRVQCCCSTTVYARVYNTVYPVKN